MAVQCAICHAECKEKPRTTAESSVMCVKCEKWSHIPCVSQGNRKISTKNYECNVCSGECEDGVTDEVMSAGNGMEIASKLEKIMKKLEKLDHIERKVGLIDDVKKSMDDLKDKMMKMETRIDALEVKVTESGVGQAVVDEVQDLRDENEGLKQYLRINNLVISGIPDVPEVDPKQAVIDLANYLGLTLKEDNIDIAHRLPTRQKGKDRPIVVKFAQRWCKEQLMDKVIGEIKQKKVIDTKGLGYTAPNATVFINEHLTPNMQKIHYQARQLKKEGKISSVHVKKGKIIVKKSKEDSSHTKIHSLQDLKKFEE